MILPEEQVNELLQKAQATPGYTLTIDLAAQTVSDTSGFSAQFEIDPFVKLRLLNGLDEIGMTLQHDAAITSFEEKRAPWLTPA